MRLQHNAPVTDGFVYKKTLFFNLCSDFSLDKLIGHNPKRPSLYQTSYHAILCYLSRKGLCLLTLLYCVNREDVYWAVVNARYNIFPNEYHPPRKYLFRTSHSGFYVSDSRDAVSALSRCYVLRERPIRK